MAAPEFIALDQPRRGYRDFIGCWLYRIDDLVLVIDPGPTSTIAHLVDELRARDVDRLDLIVLTHIHLDHGGGAGRLLRSHPDARIVCHPPAADHLVDPSRLWAGSLEVLGETARLFGEPDPVPADRIDRPDSLAARGIRAVPTPGHAPHHWSFVHGDLLFAGEAAGVTVPGVDGPYLRPATPPRFFPDAYLGSLDRLLALDPLPERIAFAHAGLCDDAPALLRAARDQVGRWIGVIAEESRPGERTWSDDLRRRVTERLLDEDPWFARHADLDADIRDREAEYLRNTLEGILGRLAVEDDA